MLLLQLNYCKVFILANMATDLQHNAGFTIGEASPEGLNCAG